MVYKILYNNGQAYNFSNGTKDLKEWFKLLKDEEITDIIKIYKNGNEVSVFETYKDMIQRYK